MSTQNRTRTTTPVEPAADAIQLNPSNEGNQTEGLPEKEDDTPDLDEDIMMYMIHI